MILSQFEAVNGVVLASHVDRVEYEMALRILWVWTVCVEMSSHFVIIMFCFCLINFVKFKVSLWHA